MKALLLALFVSALCFADQNVETLDGSTYNANLSIRNLSVHATLKKNETHATVYLNGTLSTGLGGPGKVVVEKVLVNPGQVFYVVKPVETPTGGPTIEGQDREIPFSLTLSEPDLNHNLYTFTVLNGALGGVSTVTISAKPY